MSVRLRLAAAVLFICCTSSMLAATFTVSSSADSGPNTLRQAIIDANANAGLDQIVFTTNVVITSLLPFLTDVVEIDGTISGTTRARIELTPAIIDAVILGFAAGSSGSTVRDLDIPDVFTDVFVDAAVSGVTVENLLFGGAITLSGDSNIVDSNTGGGFSRIRIVGGDNNEIYSNSLPRISVETGSNNNRVGIATRGNTVVDSVLVTNAPGTIIEANTISGSTQGLVLLQASPVGAPLVENNTIHSSVIGIDVLAPGTIIRGNTIRDNGTGIRVQNVTAVAITSNSIFSNNIPIDLGIDGAVTPNDPAPDADTSGNNLQNFPVLTSAVASPASLVVQGTLTSAPLTEYQIQLFSNPPGDAEARTLIDDFNVTTDALGNAIFNRVIAPLPPIVINGLVTATATNRSLAPMAGNGPNDTSEVSAGVAITGSVGIDGVPTMSTWGLIALALGLAFVALLRRA